MTKGTRRLGCRHKDFNRSNVPTPRSCRLCTGVVPAELLGKGNRGQKKGGKMGEAQVHPMTSSSKQEELLL